MGAACDSCMEPGEEGEDVHSRRIGVQMSRLALRMCWAAAYVWWPGVTGTKGSGAENSTAAEDLLESSYGHEGNSR